MEELKILIVEDDNSIYKDVYERNIKVYNKEDHDFQLVSTRASNKEEAINLLKDEEQIFDGAIVDLDLEGTVGIDTSGNDVIDLIKRKLRFPTFVITGTPQNVSREFAPFNDFLKVFERDEVDELKVFSRFEEIKKTGILNLLNRNGTIENLISDIFWKHLSNSLNIWIDDDSRNSEQKEKSLLRYTILHMLEYLDEENVHPSEFLITPPVKKELSTGEIISFNDERYTVLTPACDFAQNKVINIFLLRIKEISEVIDGFDTVTKIENLSRKKQERLRRIIRNNYNSYCHFIPRHKEINSGIIDFQDKLSIPLEEFHENLNKNKIERLGVISSPFLKELIQRYSSYYSRQGSPDFNTEEVINMFLKSNSEENKNQD